MAKSLIPGADDWKKKRGIKTESETPSLKINGKATSEVAKDVTAKHSAPQKKTAAQSTAERSLPNIKYNFTGAKTQQKPRSLFGDVTGADFAKSGLRRVTDYATAKTRADYDENLRRIGLTRNADKDKLRREAYKLFEQQSRYDMYDFDIQNLSNVSQKLRAFKITKENLKEYEKLKKEYEQANARFNVAMAAKQQARERLLRKQEKEADKELKASVAEYLKQSGRFTAEPQKKESPYKSVEVGNKYFDRLMKNFSNDNPLSRINEAQAQADYLERDYKRRADEITKERTALESEYERLSAGNGTPGEIESFNKRVSDFNGKAAKLESDAALYNGKIKDINENFRAAADSYSRSETEKNRANALTDFIEQSYRERKERAKTNPSESQKIIMSISNGMQMADPNKFGLPVGDFTDSVTELALRRFTREEKEVYYSTLSTQPDMAEDYFNKILKKHEEEIWSERTKAFEAFAAHGIGGKIGAVALNSLYSMPKTAEDIVYTAKRASGNDMDRNLSKVSESLRRGAARDVKSGFGQLLLDAGFSTGEMLATFLFSGGIGSLASSVAGANAAAKGTRYGSYFIRSMADSMDEVLQRGGTDDQAWTLGILNGAAEVLAECLGTEKWFALLGKPRGTVSRVIKEAVKRAGSEFTEEALTEVAQKISDGFVMGEESEYSAYIRELIKAGLTEAEANAEAFKEFFIKNPLKAGATGAISAAMTGAGADIRNAAQVYSEGKQISNSPEAMSSLKEAAEDVLKQNYMGRNAEYIKGLQKDISNALEASANAKGKFGAAWNAGKARAGLAELYNTPKLSINSDTVFSDLRNEERNGAAQFSVVGETEDGRKIYKDNFPPNTPKDIKQEKLISLVQNIWSKQPITLTLNSGDTITAKFNPELSERSDLAKMAFGNRKGTNGEKRMTLGLAPDFYQIATDSKHTGTKAETGKTNPAHDGVYQWEYFVTDLVFEENDGKRIDCHMNIDVKRNANGDYFYSFGLEKGTAPRTLLAAVNDSKSPTVPSTNSIRENGEKYNSNFNQNNKWTFERIAQLDNAVKKSGVNIIIEDIPQAEVEGNKVRQGAYYRNANTIVIDPRVSDVQIANTVLFHELAHSTEGTKYYDEFKNYIKGIKGEEFITETEKKMKSLRLSREEAESEAVADFVKDIFLGGTEEMNGFLSKDYTAAREITDTMKNIIDSVKIRFGVEPSSVYERAVRSFEKALAKRETGGETTQYSDRITEEDIRYSTGEVSPEEKARLIKEDREKEINSGVFFTDGKRRNYNSSMSMWQVHSYEGKAGEEPKGDSGRIFGRKKEDKGLTSLIKEISKAYNLPINQGKVVGKNSSAEYHVRRETVRTRNVNDLPVVTHELGHHLDKNFKLVTAVEDAGQINNIVRLAGNRFLSSYSRVFDDLYLNQKKYVRALLKEYGSTTNPKEVLQNIQNLSDTVNEINQRDGAELLGVTREELPERLKQAKENEKAIREAAEIAARSILRNIEIENESGEALKKISGILRNSPFTISRSDASNIADYGSFIKKYVGVLKVKIATEGETGKRSIDSVYQTLRNEMPQYFTKDLQNGGDMLQEISDVLSMLREERNVSIEDYSQSKEYVDELCKKLYKATAFGTGEARNATLADIENKITELETKRSKTRSEEQAAKMSGRIAKLYNELETVKKESVAEFIREYMRDSGAVDKSIKEAIIKAIPGKELEKFQKYAGKTNQYYSEGLLERLSQSGRHFGESERKETSLNDAIDNAMFNWVDDMWGVKKATDAAEKASGQTLSGQDNPYVLIMNAKNAMGTVERIVKNGMTNLEGDINLGKSLVDILKQTNDINGFEDYLKARRAVTWLTPDKDGKAKRVFADAELNNLWNAKKMVNDLEAKHPEFEEMANEIYNFQNQIIQYFGVEGGLISKETADSMLKKEPNYIPFYRDMSDKHKNARGAHKKAANVLKGASGSTRDILSPIESIIKNVETYVTLAKQQQALRALYNAIEGNEKLGWLAEAVEPDKKVSKIETSPVATQFLKAQDVLNGIMPADDESYGAEVQKFIDLLGQTIIKTEDKRSSSQNNMIPVLMSGEIKWLRVNDEILLKSLTNINRGEINPVIRIMTAFTNVFKTVSTSANIAFTFGSNMGKDFVHAVFSTDSKGGLPGYAARYGKSLVQEIRKSEDFQRYLNVGGKWASSIVQDRNGFKKLLRDVNAAKSPKLVKAVRYWVLGIFDRMQDIADWVETAPRYTEFRSTYKKSGDIMQALYDSGEITVNFKRSGKKARYVEPFVPYSNAAIQGTRQVAAVTKKHPVRTLARVAAYSTLISIAAAWMRGRKDDREYENLSSYVKNNFWTVPLGGGEYISVKKPDGFGALCTVIDRAVEGIQYKNPSVFNDIASYIVGQFTPYGILEGLTEGVETAIKEKNGLKGIAAGLQDAGNNFMNGIIILGTMYQIGTNKDFKGSNIVPRKYEDMPPEEQFDENTSWIAKFLGRQLGISPMKIDHAIDSNLGIFAKVNKLTASTDEKDWFLGLASRYTKSAAFSTDIINNFYDEYDKAVKKKNVSDNPEDLMTYSFYNAERNVIGNLYNIMNEATTAEERKSVKYEMNHYIKALSQPKNEKVDNELKRLSGTEKFKSDILPYVSGDVAIKENGYDRKLSAAEYVKLQKTLEEKMYSSYEKVISSPGYAALSDGDKISALRKVREAVKDRTEFEAFENQDFSYLAKLMKADTLSKENVLYKSRNNTKTAAKYLEAMEPFTGGTLESNTALYAYKNADSYMNYMEKYSLLTAEAAQTMNEYAIKRSKAVTRGDAARFGKVNETAYLFDAESIFEWTVNGNEFGIEPTPEQAYNAYILFDRDLDTALQRAYTNGFYTNKGDRATYTDKYGNKQPAIWQQMPPDKLTEKIGKEKTRVKEKIRSSMQNSGKVNWYETMPDGTIVRHR